MTWEKLQTILIVVGVLFLLSEIVARIFWRGDDGERVDTRDPEGGTIGKMINWHKRTPQHTIIGWRPDPIYKQDGYTEGKPLDDGTPVYHKPIKRR